MTAATCHMSHSIIMTFKVEKFQLFLVCFFPPKLFILCGEKMLGISSAPLIYGY